MIERLQHRELEVAQKIRHVFQVSYKIEAKLLNATYFPPLKRPLEDFIESTTAFYGFSKEGELAGVVEIDHNNHFTLIRSLVVNPAFFRQGIAGKLIAFVFDAYDSKLFVVETGVANGPATQLYIKYGFTEVKQWDTEYGIRKIKFEKRTQN